MTGEPLVSVVVPTRGAPVLEECLAALAAQSFERLEVVVVADGVPAPDAPGARLVALPERMGFAAAVNAGVAAAAGSVVAILNDDAFVRSDWVAEGLACLERHPRAASVATKVVRSDDASVLDGCGDTLTRSLKAYRRGQGARDDGRYDREEEVFGASGTACLWRRAAFEALGGYDARFVAYYEDVDLAFRARLAGYEAWYAPWAVAAHRGGATSAGEAALFDGFYAARNRWAMIVKDAPRSWLVRRAPLLVAAEAASLARAAADGRLRLHVDAARSVLRERATWRTARAEVQRSRVSAPAELDRLLERAFPPLRASVARARRSGASV
jgi:GT2 family glycosyltransferase